MPSIVDMTNYQPDNSEPEIPVNTVNEYILMTGQNLPNHSTSLAGRGKYVKVGRHGEPIYRTKQEAYRYAAYLLTMADTLPDEDGAHTYQEVEEAIRNA